PGGERDEPGDEGQRGSRVDEVEQPAADRQQGKGAHAARPRLAVAPVEVLKGQAEEEGEPQQQGKVRDRRYRHGRRPALSLRRRPTESPFYPPPRKAERLSRSGRGTP